MKKLGKINELLSRDDMKEIQGGYPGCIDEFGTCCVSNPTHDYCCSNYTCTPNYAGGVFRGYHCV